MSGQVLDADLGVDRARLAAVRAREVEGFAAVRPRSRALAGRARGSLLGGVPMTWMMRWAGPHPVFLAEAKGARVVDVDGHEDADLCLGDTGAMAGHAPEPVVRAVAARAAAGITAMLPTEDAAWSGEEFARRFGLPRCRLGARAEYRFAPQPPRHGGESAAAGDVELERFLHLYALNRGVLITPWAALGELV